MRIYLYGLLSEDIWHILWATRDEDLECPLSPSSWSSVMNSMLTKSHHFPHQSAATAYSLASRIYRGIDFILSKVLKWDICNTYFNCWFPFCGFSFQKLILRSWNIKPKITFWSLRYFRSEELGLKSIPKLDSSCWAVVNILSTSSFVIASSGFFQKF